MLDYLHGETGQYIFLVCLVILLILLSRSHFPLVQGTVNNLPIVIAKKMFFNESICLEIASNANLSPSSICWPEIPKALITKDRRDPDPGDDDGTDITTWSIVLQI